MVHNRMDTIHMDPQGSRWISPNIIPVAFVRWSLHRLSACRVPAVENSMDFHRDGATPSPSHHLYRWYVYHPQMGSLWHCFNHHDWGFNVHKVACKDLQTITDAGCFEHLVCASWNQQKLLFSRSPPGMKHWTMDNITSYYILFFYSLKKYCQMRQHLRKSCRDLLKVRN